MIDAKPLYNYFKSIGKGEKDITRSLAYKILSQLEQDPQDMEEVINQLDIKEIIQSELSLLQQQGLIKKVDGKFKYMRYSEVSGPFEGRDDVPADVLQKMNDGIAHTKNEKTKTIGNPSPNSQGGTTGAEDSGEESQSSTDSTVSLNAAIDDALGGSIEETINV